VKQFLLLVESARHHQIDCEITEFVQLLSGENLFPDPPVEENELLVNPLSANRRSRSTIFCLRKADGMKLELERVSTPRPEEALVPHSLNVARPRPARK
jgi:hypothetical protein